MASKYVEKIHEDLLKRLIEESGLECHREQEESTESETLEEGLEEQATEEEQQASLEEAVKEEEEVVKEAEAQDEEPIPFPTPSLRRMLPDKVRKIEEHNRIHVLPDEFKTYIDPDMIPKINQTPHQKYIDTLAEMVGCSKYTSSLAEFWFLDTLANLLRRAQDDKLNRATQALLILWFCEWMKEIQQFDAADRQRMLRRFEDNMISAAAFIATELRIPKPAEAGVYYKALEEVSDFTVATTTSNTPIGTKEPTVTFEGTQFECAIRDLTKITHYIYDLFGTDYQYDLVRSVYCFSPDYILIDSPYQMQVPKKFYVPPKPKKEKTSPKKEKTKDVKGKKKEPDTAEYLALMALKERDDREFEENLEKEREEYNLRSHILPLNFAATQELFDKYWPPPPPEPEPEPEPEVIQPVKGKKEKK